MENYIGKYRSIELLGHGGFADVYLAEHQHLETQAAIKIIRTMFQGDDQQSFLNEAKTIAKLHHPHIIRVLDFDFDEKGVPFLVMEYARNGNVRKLHPRGDILPMTKIVSYVNQIAKALQYVHDQKIIHRDIKPENLLFDDAHNILVSDFGLAVVEASRSITIQEIAGTVAYQSPEQLRNKPVLKSDQYALGIIVYEWMTGKPPFQGDYTAIMHQQLQELPPPIRAKNVEISDEIEAVVMKALEKDPDKRFDSVLAFAQELERAYMKTADDTIISRNPDYLPKELSTTIPGTPNYLQKEQIWSINKRVLVSTIYGIILYILVSGFVSLIKRDIFTGGPDYILSGIIDSNFSITILFPLLLLGLSETVSLFFGAAFGPWVGLLTGGIGFSLAGILSKNYSHLWPLDIGGAIAGFIAGFALLLTRGRYETRKAFVFVELIGILAQIVGGAFAMSLTLLIFAAEKYNIYQVTTWGLVMPMIKIGLIFIAPGLFLLPVLLLLKTFTSPYFGRIGKYFKSFKIVRDTSQS